MSLPTSGPINMSQVDVELGRAPDALVSLGETEVRNLANVPFGQIFLSNLYGKQYTYPAYGPGVYYFTVPSYVTSLTVEKLVAAGGGGSGTNGAGDIWGGGGGGSGGYYINETLTVIPGEVLQFTVGYGGECGLVTFNGPTLCSGTSGGTTGTNGGLTKIVRNYNTTPITLLEATGGNAGTPAPYGDNGPGAPGSGGSPNGVSGGYQSPIQRNDFAAGYGGSNGTGYGNGGYGNGTQPFTCPTKGGHGYLAISWPRTITYTSGSGTFTVPANVYSLNVAHPTSSGTVTDTLSVTPGQTISYNIGFGASLESSFGSLIYSSYNKAVGTFAGNADNSPGLRSVWGVATVNANSYSGAGYQSDLYYGAQAAGCFYEEIYEGTHGDLYATITINTMTTSLFYGNSAANAYLTNVSGRGSVYIADQPTVANGYKATVYIDDPQYSEGYYEYTLNIQQATPITISW